MPYIDTTSAALTVGDVFWFPYAVDHFVVTAVDTYGTVHYHGIHTDVTATMPGSYPVQLQKEALCNC